MTHPVAKTLTPLISRYSLVGMWAALAILFALLEPDTFATVSNAQTIFGTQSILLVLALGLCISLNAGEVDLSITGVMSVSLVLIGELNIVHGWPIVPSLIAAVLFGMVAGLINAAFIVGLGIDSLVVTLGSGTLLSGVAVWINQNSLFGVSPQLVTALNRPALGLPMAFWYVVGLTLVVWFVLRHTVFGLHLRFVGANREASHLTGIPVGRVSTLSLMLTGACAGLAAVLSAGTLGSTGPTVSSPYLLPAFAAAYLGSTTVTPGRFNALGTFIAVFFLTTGITGIQLLGSAGWVANVFYGGALVLAVAASQIVSRARVRNDAKAQRKAAAEPPTTADARVAV